MPQHGRKNDKENKVLTYEIPEAGALVGLNRNAAYAAAKRGELGRIIEFGRLKKVVKASFHEKFGPLTKA